MKSCAICNGQFAPVNGVQKYCSVDCAAQAQARRIRDFQAAVTTAIKKNKPKRGKTCPVCSKRFKTRQNRKYCSTECSASALVAQQQHAADLARKLRAERLKEIGYCKECGEAFEKQRFNQVFCGTECSRFHYDELDASGAKKKWWS